VREHRGQRREQVGMALGGNETRRHERHRRGLRQPESGARRLPSSTGEARDVDAGMHDGDRRRRHAGAEKVALLRPRGGDEPGPGAQQAVGPAPQRRQPLR
jgi:hypothetical protein